MFKRVLKHAIQRLRYGYDDTLSWGLNINLVEYTYNGLQQMITEGSKVIKWEAQTIKLNNEDITLDKALVMFRNVCRQILDFDVNMGNYEEYNQLVSKYCSYLNQLFVYLGW